MPAITALAISALKRLARHIRNRRDAARLAALDDRMLADVGLNRSDLRDAFAELPWRDPSEVLVRRAAERRASRRLSDFASVAKPASASVFGAPAAQCYPPLDRPARYLM